ncbi:MAG TPA: hypothetical protein VNL91_06740, partial [Thermoanaerobaculia bacterium]|nr:hypothetical protein [Thermoanaerobaculia bacterium]
MRKLILVASIALLLATPLLANHYASFYVIPVAGHTPGANGTLWVSDVAIQNFQTAPLDVAFVFVQSGETPFDNAAPLAVPAVRVAAGGSVMLRDVVKDFRGLASATGALLVGAERPFALTSRAYNMTTGVGQGVQPFRDFLDNSLGVTDNAMAVAYVPGLVSNASQRSNLGFVAATANTASAMGVQVTLRGADGTTLGARTYIIPAGGALMHVQFPAAALTSSSFDVASAE